MHIHPNIYNIKIRTGEILLIAEFVISRYETRYAEVFKNRPYPLTEVPYVKESVINELKSGYDRNFLPVIGNPPHVKILRVKERKCYEREYCASYNYNDCLLRITKKNQIFPRCFLYSAESPEIREIMTTIIHLWLENHYVFVVESDDVSI